jgi:hypothetical protein
VRVPAILALLVVFLSAAPAAGDCVDERGNLLANANCGFHQDIAGWTSTPGTTVSRDTDDSGHGVMKAVADTGGSLTIVSPCVKARPSAPYRFAARLRNTAGAVYFCSVNAGQFSDEGCTEGQEPLGSAGLPPGRDWEAATGSATTSDGAKSIQLRPACSGEPGFAIQFDDFVLTQG